MSWRKSMRLGSPDLPEGDGEDGERGGDPPLPAAAVVDDLDRSIGTARGSCSRKRLGSMRGTIHRDGLDRGARSLAVYPRPVPYTLAQVTLRADSDSLSLSGHT